MTIENDIPIPPARRGERTVNGIADKYGLTELEPRQSKHFKPEDWILNEMPSVERMRWRIVSYVYQLEKRTSMIFRTRTYSDGVRVWRTK